jgi:hypothetical protein
MARVRRLRTCSLVSGQSHIRRRQGCPQDRLPAIGLNMNGYEQI